MLVLVVGCTSSAYMLLGVSLVVVLIALGLACLVYVPFARRYRWGNEGRLARHLSRPAFEDEGHNSVEVRRGPAGNG